VSEPNPLTARLEALRGTLPGLADLATLAGLAVELRALRGIGEEPQTSLAGLLAGLRGSTGATLEDIYGELAVQGLIVEDTRDKLAALAGQVTALYTQLDEANRAHGAIPYESLDFWSTRGGLWAIYTLLRNWRYGAGPAPGGGSSGSIGDTIIEGKRYAKFAPPIEGVSVSTDGISLTPNVSWAGWEGYIQSAAPLGYISGEEVQTGLWHPLPLGEDATFSVDLPHLITAYIRPPAGSEWWYPSTPLDAITAPAASYHMVVWPAGIDATTISPLGVNRWGERVYRTDVVTGYRLRVVEGGIVSYDAYVGTASETIPITSEWYTITGNPTTTVLYATEPFIIAFEPGA
jgi:hypothetical protein